MTLKLDINKGQLSSEELSQLADMRKRCARRILLSTSLSSSGHPGGSLSTLDFLLVAYGMINHNPDEPLAADRDRVVMSIGHISPGVYAVLSEYGYFSEEEFLTGFRRAESGFPGHVEKIVPGVEWDTGNLGQGLSTGVGMAMAIKQKGGNQKVIVLMGDGEQQKGQISEAIRFARKYDLNNLIVVVDRNHLQICGNTADVMDQKIRETFAISNWNVSYIEDGNDPQSIATAFSDIYNGRVADPAGPSVLVARTIMSKGVSFMENLAKYHGSPLKGDDLAKALEELGVENDFDKFMELRQEPVSEKTKMSPKSSYPKIESGEPVTYSADTMTDNRSAYGTALLGLAEANNKSGNSPKIVGISCDLEGSVKMGGFHKHSPEAYLEAGIQEHHAASMAGAMSREDMAVFYSTFGVFTVSEVYNQNRINDINHTNMKAVATHVGLDVGEDGPTHQCIDYVGLLRNLYGFEILLPADPNQTDRIIRYAAMNAGNHFVGMGRSKTPVITNEEGEPFFAGSYQFDPNKADRLRTGNAGTIMTYGAMTTYVMTAWEKLKEDGIDVGVLNIASLKPLDREAIIEAARKGPVLTVEDHHIDTGLGAIAGLVIAEEQIQTSFKRLGVTRYASSGKPADLYASQGLDPDSIAASFKELLEKL
jgi:transketolase